MITSSEGEWKSVCLLVWVWKVEKFSLTKVSQNENIESWIHGMKSNCKVKRKNCKEKNWKEGREEESSSWSSVSCHHQHIKLGARICSLLPSFSSWISPHLRISSPFPLHLHTIKVTNGCVWSCTFFPTLLLSIPTVPSTELWIYVFRSRREEEERRRETVKIPKKTGPIRSVLLSLLSPSPLFHHSLLSPTFHHSLLSVTFSSFYHSFLPSFRPLQHGRTSLSLPPHNNVSFRLILLSK